MPYGTVRLKPDRVLVRDMTAARRGHQPPTTNPQSLIPVPPSTISSDQLLHVLAVHFADVDVVVRVDRHRGGVLQAFDLVDDLAVLDVQMYRQLASVPSTTYSRSSLT